MLIGRPLQIMSSQWRLPRLNGESSKQLPASLDRCDINDYRLDASSSSNPCAIATPPLAPRSPSHPPHPTVPAVAVDVFTPLSSTPPQASSTTLTMVRPATRFAQTLRHRLQFQQTRFASTNPTTEAAQKKAQDALASAQKYAGQAVEKGRKFLGPFGDKLANAFGGAYHVTTL